MLLFAIVFINLAFIFYTIGVWSEKLQKSLKTWHVVIFWIGLVFDTIGTSFMGAISGNGFSMTFHGVTGMIAILLMLVHAIWATVVILKKDILLRESFHKLSVVVWFIWLIPMVTGMIFGMAS